MLHLPAAEIAAAALCIDVGVIESVEPIKQGLTNRSWLVRAANHAVVVRLNNPAHETLQINRVSEAAVLRAAAIARIAPEVLLCDVDRGVLVTRYAGPALTEAAPRMIENSKRIAGLLRRLHLLPPPPQTRRVHLLAVVDDHLQTLEQSGARIPTSIAALRTRARQIATLLQQGSNGCLCHNDLHHLNIVEGGGALRLIDWQYAGIGERMFDLASVCVYHRYDKPLREQLLAAYAMHPGVVAWHRLELACWLFEYIRDLWMEVRSLERTPLQA